MTKKQANRAGMLIAATMLIVLFIFAMWVYLSLPVPTPSTTGDQILELAHQRAIEFDLTKNRVVQQPSLGKDGRLEYSTICYYYPPYEKFDPRAVVIVCEEWTTIYYDDGRGIITLNPHTLGAVPQFLQGMPPGSLLYSMMVEESAKIDQVIFWIDQGRLYPEK